MPPFQVLNPVGDIKPGASVLATVSDADGQTYPALVAQRFGLGRTGALMIGDLWRWGLGNEAMQKDLGKSWRQLVRWLVSDVPQQISVSPETSVGGDPAEVRLTVKAHDDEFKPLDNATVQLTVRPVGSASSKNEKTNYVQLTAEPSATSRELMKRLISRATPERIPSRRSSRNPMEKSPDKPPPAGHPIRRRKNFVRSNRIARCSKQSPSEPAEKS